MLRVFQKSPIRNVRRYSPTLYTAALGTPTLPRSTVEIHGKRERKEKTARRFGKTDGEECNRVPEAAQSQRRNAFEFAKRIHMLYKVAQTCVFFVVRAQTVFLHLQMSES
jgi:hypothetical protein